MCADLSLASLLQLGKDITTYAKALTKFSVYVDQALLSHNS